MSTSALTVEPKSRKTALIYFSCKSGVSKKTRHDCINKLILRKFKQHAVAVIPEPQGLISNNNTLPDGVTLVPFFHGKCLTWDVTVIHPTSKSYIESACLKNLTAANQAEEKKKTKYSNLAPEYLFSPLVLETFGAFGSQFLHTFRSLQKFHRNDQIEKAHFFQNL